MAVKAGLLGFAKLNGLDTFKPYTVDAGNKAAVTISLCNGSNQQIVVKMAYISNSSESLTAALAAGKGLLGGTVGRTINSGDTVQVTTMLGAGQGVAASSSVPGEVSLTINGIEELL